jgi:hypothetical protein
VDKKVVEGGQERFVIRGTIRYSRKLNEMKIHDSSITRKYLIDTVIF